LRVHSASSIAGLIGNLFSGDGWVRHRESPFRCWLVCATPAKDICWYRVMSTSKTCMVVFMRLSDKYAVPEELALLSDFVNTLDARRYVERGVVHAGGDELATPRRMEAWMRKHRLLASGKHVDAAAHRQALDLRSALRSFLELPPAERGNIAAARRLTAASRGSLARYASAFLTRSGVNGAWRKRVPVSWAIALPIAGVTNGVAICPTPVGALSVDITSMCINGTSLMRGIR